MQTLGDILQAAIDGRAKPLIEVTLHAPRRPLRQYNPYTRGAGNIIPNIKALREATRMGEGSSDVMSLTDAKNAIEAIRDRGSVIIRMTPERYGYFMVNRRSLTNYEWQVKSSAFYVPPPPEPAKPTVFTI